MTPREPLNNILDHPFYGHSLTKALRQFYNLTEDQPIGSARWRAIQTGITNWLRTQP